MALLSNTNVTHIAVVGGTGAYEGVTGSVLSVSRGENSPFTDDTVHLIWPRLTSSEGGSAAHWERADPPRPSRSILRGQRATQDGAMSMSGVFVSCTFPRPSMPIRLRSVLPVPPVV
jgi:hypothetical protein